MLYEVRQSDHYTLRKAERGKILDLKVPQAAYKGYDFKEVEPKLIQDISERLFGILRGFEGKQSSYSGAINRVFLVLRPTAIKDGKQYPITMHVKSSKFDKETQKATLVDNYGEAYVLIITQGTLVTLLLYKQEDTSDDRLAAKALEHLRREKPELADNPMKVMPTTGWDYKIVIDELFKGREVGLSQAEVTKEELPYRVRTDYRKGADFKHDTLGTGTIVSTSNGQSGQPNANGILQWVDVDFKKPILKGGKLISIIRVPNIYATAYWLGKA